MHELALARLDPLASHVQLVDRSLKGADCFVGLVTLTPRHKHRSFGGQHTMQF